MSANSGFTGTGQLLRLFVRRDRVLATAWAAFLVLLVVGTAVQYLGLFPTPQAKAEFVAEVRGNAALNAFTGQLYGDGIGNLTMWKIGDIAFSLISVMAVLTVVRHTRAEEETGRAELVAAGVVGRFAALTAALTVACVLSVVIGVLTALGLIGIGADATGAMIFGLALAAPGCVLAVTAALAAQLTERARAAVAIAGTALGVGYLVRFVADGSGRLWLRWLSPNGWSHLTEPFGENRVWVLVVPLAAAVVIGAIAYRLAARRDLGAGAVPARLGPAHGAPSLRSPLALAWRMHRGQLLGWTAGFTAFSAATAAVAGGMTEIADRAGPQVQEFLRRYAATPDAGIADTFIWLIILSLAGLAALYPMLATLRLRTEETSGRAELTLSTAVGRVPWGTAHLVIAAVGPALMLAAAGLAAGLVHGVVTGDLAGQLPRVWAAALVQIPAVWVIGACAIVAVGVIPRLAVAAVWVVFLLVNLFGESLGPILGLDYWLASQIIPFHHIPKILTGGPFQAAPLIVMVALTAVLATLGLLALRRRDLG